MILHLHPNDVRTLKNELRRQQPSLDEFEISATRQRLDEESDQISANHGAVTIKLNKTGTERAY